MGIVILGSPPGGPRAHECNQILLSLKQLTSGSNEGLTKG